RRGADDRVRQVHDPGTDRLPHRLKVVRRTTHQVTRARGAEERRVETDEVAEERVAQIRFDPAADRVQQLTHAEAGRAGQQCCADDEAGEAQQVGTCRLSDV